MPDQQPQTATTPTVVFDHVENMAKLMSADEAFRKLAEPLDRQTNVQATSGIPQSAS
jgi:hypothetical protein